jgi:hypothetical protein
MHGASAGERAVEPADDGRLRELLAVEKRLEDLVRAAEEDGAHRIIAARATREQRLAEARAAAELADAAHAREEQAVHAQTLASIERDHWMVLAATRAPDDRVVDELARWAIAQVIAPTGEPA